jgi:hypothetical protein
MLPSFRPMLLLILLVLAPATASATEPSPCDQKDTGFTDPVQSAIVCYAGTFLVKMLEELNSGGSKTVQHVRVHLLPYLGGMEALTALLDDDMDNGECSVCYGASKATHDGLLGLR